MILILWKQVTNFHYCVALQVTAEGDFPDVVKDNIYDKK